MKTEQTLPAAYQSFSPSSVLVMELPVDFPLIRERSSMSTSCQVTLEEDLAQVQVSSTPLYPRGCAECCRPHVGIHQDYHSTARGRLTARQASQALLS